MAMAESATLNNPILDSLNDILTISCQLEFWRIDDQTTRKDGSESGLAHDSTSWADRNFWVYQDKLANSSFELMIQNQVCNFVCFVLIPRGLPISMKRGLLSKDKGIKDRSPKTKSFKTTSFLLSLTNASSFIGQTGLASHLPVDSGYPPV